ncbi:unnamed protein product [Bursaphelenchus okinawaensis]|uniref:Carboxylesterase type B domain-containing protein n=1 Tax=Bursaphelenchus okinawaensis TaxID=465554 RepID=A0A811LT52_9BILA|nr:unnamed protein product [Bursaphelenchus okinawaensis]CAG9128092.1 unnamed protein product [Bursaphelenchus okinawaensis]
MFKGVPYAESPINESRFGRPKEKKPWDNSWDCTNYQSNCPNISPVSLTNANGSEDCLYLNVLANKKCFDNKCPVMFYIHGGSFYFGFPLEIKEEEIIEKYVSKNVIFVTLAYRENIFGFPNFVNTFVNKNHVNLGFYDILQALKFINQNINRMGGNHKNVTVMGNSSGASAVLYLISSPAVEPGLFSQAWVSSPMPYVSPARNVDMTTVVTKSVGCGEINPKNTVASLNILSCLKKIPEKVLTEAVFNGLKQYEWTHTGPQTEEILFPVQSFDQLLKWWKPTRLWISTTTDEMSIESSQSNLHMCQHYCGIFGYTKPTTLAFCAKNFDNRRRKIVQAYHALGLRLAEVNDKAGGQSYLELFGQDGHTGHANDLTFVIGWHKNGSLNESDSVLDREYRQWLVNFAYGEDPNLDFKPFSLVNQGFYYVNYTVSNGTVLNQPKMIWNRPLDAKANQFWLTDLAFIENPEAFNTSYSTTTYSTPHSHTKPTLPHPIEKNRTFNYHFMTFLLLFLTLLLLALVILLLWNRLHYRPKTTIYVDTASERTPLIQTDN